MRDRIAGTVLLSSLLQLASASPAHAHADLKIPVRRPDAQPIWVGERHEMEVTYAGFPGLDVSLEVLPIEQMDQRPVFHVRAHATASALVGIFFRINDTVDTWFDADGLYSHRLELNQDNSQVKRHSVETYDPIRDETVFDNQWQDRNGPPQALKKSFPLPEHFVQDNFSAMLYLRSLPLKEGESYVTPVASEGNVIQVRSTVTGIRPRMVRGRRYPSVYSIRLDKLGPDGQPLPGDNWVYLTADRRRTLLEVSVKAKFGRVVAYLKRFVEGKAP